MPKDSVLQFPISRSADMSGDPRWRRLEALFRDIVRLKEPMEADRHLARRMEQMFAALVPDIIRAMSTEDRVRMRMSIARFDYDNDRRRSQDSEDVAWRRRMRWEPLNADARLDDLLIDAQRTVEDLRREHARAQNSGVR